MQQLPPPLKNSWAAKFLPFLTMGLSIVLFIIGIIVFSYILIIAAIIGVILFSIGYIRAKFFMKNKEVHRYNKTTEDASGRVIEHEEIEIKQKK